MECIVDFFSKVSADGWMNFSGQIIGSVLTLCSIIVAIKAQRKQDIRKQKEKQNKYHNRLLESLPSIDILCTQSDYLNDEDSLLGGFSSAEARTEIMKKRMNSDSYTDEEREHYRYKIRCHEEYLKYWDNANKKLIEFMENGSFNVIKAECELNVILGYYDFVVAFRNEHNYSGPVITTDRLKELLIKLARTIVEANKI